MPVADKNQLTGVKFGGNIKVSDFDDDIQSIEEKINEVTESDAIKSSHDKLYFGDD